MRFPTFLKTLAVPVGISLTAAAMLTAPAHAFTKYSFSGSGLTADGEDWSLDGMFEVDQDTGEVRNDVFDLNIDGTNVTLFGGVALEALAPFFKFDESSVSIITAEIFLTDREDGDKAFDNYSVLYLLGRDEDTGLFFEDFSVFEADPEGTSSINTIPSFEVAGEFTDGVEQPVYLSLSEGTDTPGDGDGGQKVPEPSTMFSLLGLGLGALATKRKLSASTKN